MTSDNEEHSFAIAHCREKLTSKAQITKLETKLFLLKNL